MVFSRWVRALRARPTTAPSRRPRTLDRVFETLEDRAVPAGLRAIDEVGNNLANPAWGSTGSDFIRIAPAAYADGISAAVSTRPSARTISNAVVSHPADDVKNSRYLSNFAYEWGQFIDHDIDLTNTASSAGSLAITVPTGDASFDPNSTGTATIAMTRSQYDPATGVTSPRKQVNSITAFLDGSQVYGSDAATAASLRTFSGGLLKTSAGNLLPFDPASPANFLAGDVRVNENPELTAVQTLFLREHNRLAAQLHAANPTWNDEKLDQEARRRVIAEIEAITVNEYLPALLGQSLPQYQGYNPKVNPGISNEFSTAAFRHGHSMLGNDIEFLDDSGNEVAPAVLLKDAFFNPSLVTANGIDPLLKYLASDNCEEIDTKVVDSLRNFLFGNPGQGGFDLAALNIQRGRDHGLSDYNTTRVAYGLPAVTSFAQITSDTALQQQLQSLYGTVSNIDLWVGGLAENHLPGGSMGALFTRIISDQFLRTRDGDRFWYERDFSGRELSDLQHTTLASVIRHNSSLVNLQDNVFFFNATITGTVFGDGNHNGMRNNGEQGLGGRTVQLLDADGAVVATTITGMDGRYAFANLSLGTYTVREVLPTGATATTPLPIVVVNSGKTTSGVDLGEYPSGGPTTHPPGHGGPAGPGGPMMPPGPGHMMMPFDFAPILVG